MRLTLLACALLATPVAAFAEGFSYTNVDVSYISSDVDTQNISFNGIQVGGSLGIGPYVQLSNRLTYVKTKDTPGTNDDSKVFDGRLYAGGHINVNPSLDLVANAGYIYQDVDAGGAAGGDSSESGYTINTGVRMQVIPQLEISGLYVFEDLADEQISGFELQGEVKIWRGLAGIASANYAAKRDTYTFGVRYNF